MAHTWADVRAEIARNGVFVRDVARHMGYAPSTMSTILNTDAISEPKWEVWMDAIKACSQGTPTR